MIKVFELFGPVNNENRIFITKSKVEGPICYRPNKIPDDYKLAYENMKFHVGDHVWYSEFLKYRVDKSNHRIIEIVELFCEEEDEYYLFKNDENSGTWAGEKELILIHDYEVDAEKYNL
jgi:hypothetical protein